MSHSYAESANLTCSHCQQTFDAEVWFIVDAGEHPDLIERIKQGALHTFTCPHCQQAVTIDAALLIFRTQGNPVLLFSPAQATSNDQDQEHARWLVRRLRDDMGDQWQDDWLSDGLHSVSRDQLPSVISGDLDETAPAPEYFSELRHILQELSQPSNGVNIERRAQLCQRALVLLQRADNPPLWAALQGELGNSLVQSLTGERAENVEQAIQAYQQALAVRTREAMPAEWAQTMMNLANAYSDRIRGERAENVELAIAAYQQALAVRTREALPVEWAQTMMNLATAYSDRIRGERAENVELAIAGYQQALEVLTRQALPVEWATTMMNLANAYYSRIRGERAENVEQAIAGYQQALEVRTRQALPVEWAQVMMNLATAYRNRIRGERAENVELAIQAYQQALEVFQPEALPDDCRRAARNLSRLCFTERRYAQSVEAALLVMQATDVLLQAALLRSSKEVELGELQEIPTSTAYALIQLGELGQAAEILERGRTRLLAEALEQNRRDLEQLLELGHRPVYERYRRAVSTTRQLQEQAVHQDASTAEKAQGMGGFAALRQEIERARAELTAAADDIRRIPGYEDFFRSLPFARIQAQATTNVPLVYLAMTSAGSLGLIVWPDAVEAIDMAVTEEDLNRLLVEWEAPEGEVTGGYLAALLGVASTLPTELAKMLPILGDKLAPLVDHLRARGATSVTLIPTGRLSLLPLHAATYTRDGKTLCLLDEFDVAYAPSAQALAAARESVQQRDSVPLRLAGVGNPLPNPRPLTYAKPELQSLVELMPVGAAQPLYEMEATKPALAIALPGATVAHLSCHGFFNVAEPLDSGLMLGDGTWTLREILDQPKALETVRLAVLSACQTAITDFADLPDEAIGLPAGLLQAGVPAIVGTLWSVDDASTALLMVRFYELMLSEHLRPHVALCRAQRWLRDLTVRDLEEYLARHEAIAKARAEAGDRMSDSLSHALNLKVFTADSSDAQPFHDPYYWAPFTFTGATEVAL